MSCDWGALSDRVKLVLTDPKGCWSAIKSENKSIKEIYMSYLIPLAGIGLLCTVLGNIIFGGGGLIAGIVGGIVSVALALGLLMVVAYIYKFVAGQFQSSASEVDTFKLVAYGATASYVGKFLGIIPVLAPLEILFSIYGVYILYQGITPMTGISEKRLPYFIACFVVTFVVMVVVTAVVLGALGFGKVGLGI